MASSHGSTSWVWRRLRWLLVALMLPFMLPVGVEPVAAETPPGYGFQWGPSRPPGTFENVLDDPNVRWALDFFVDEDSISTRVLGEPSLLVYADDATYPNELESGSTIFAPEKGKYLLEAAEVDSLTLTIAADPQLPESRQLAEAIAEDLRNNAGAQVGIVDVDSDFVVGRALGQSAQAAPGAISFEVACTPDTFRADEWTVVECVSQIRNQGETTLIPYVTIDAGNGPIPQYFFVSAEQYGFRVPVSTAGLRFRATELVAGRVVTTRVIALLKMSEGTYESNLDVNVAGEVVATAPLRFTASTGAEAPPTGIEVTRRLVEMTAETRSGPAPAQPEDGRAEYETVITNNSQQTVSALAITIRLDRTLLLSSVPSAPDEDFQNGLFTWDLPMFGKESLAPGESLVLKTAYSPETKGWCESIATAGVVEATVDGDTQRYAVPEEWEAVGYCPGGGGGGDFPSALAQGGEGQAGRACDVLWAATCLAAGGMTLVGLATLVRKRARR